MRTIREAIYEAVHLRTDNFADSATFAELNFDSIDTLEMLWQLEREFAIKLSDVDGFVPHCSLAWFIHLAEQRIRARQPK
jgi:acyl carrier protein